MAIMDSHLPSRRQITETLQQIDDGQEVALEILGKIADEYKSCNDLKNVQTVTDEMQDNEEITTEVKERAQAYLDPRRDKASSIATVKSFRGNINNNWGPKTEAEYLRSARYQRGLVAVMTRFFQLQVNEKL